MTSEPLPGRRTRSQIKLSDDILRVPEHSPMKAARDAVHKGSEPPNDMGSLAESEDELLLSPNKGNTFQRSKRSVSPPPNDGYNTGVGGEISGRESKRMKWDIGGEEGKNPTTVPLTNAGHVRTSSEPQPGPSRKPIRKRAGTTSSKKPNSTSQISSSPILKSPTGVSGKTRAQSVPLFSSLPSLPHLDLRKPPPSPVRARSTSSADRYHGLKVYPSPLKPSAPERQQPQVEASLDDPNVHMEVDEDCSTRLAVDADNTIESNDNKTAPVLEASIRPPTSPPPQVPASVPSLNPPIIPATPMPSESLFIISMSPLTPLPPTPLPTKSAVGEDRTRYNIDNGWGFGLEKGSDMESPLKPISQPDFGNTKNMLLAPSATDSALGGKIPGPSLSPPPNPVNTETVKRPLLKVAPHKKIDPSSSSMNAFSFLMNNAAKQHASKSQDKGKGKVVSLLPQGSSTTNTKGKGKSELEGKKPSLKDRMRRKEKQQPPPPTKFVPILFDEDENEERAESEEGEFKVEVPQKLEPVVPKLGGKPPPSESDVPEKLGELLPGLLAVELPTPEVLPTQEPEGKPLPESRVILETIPQPSLPTPSPGEPAEPSANVGRSAPPTPVISEAPVVSPENAQVDALAPIISEPLVAQEQHDLALSPQMVVESVAANDAVQADSEVSVPADVSIVQVIGDSVLAPQTVDTSLGQPVEPPKPKIVPKKRGRSNIPTSTRVTRSTVKPPLPPVAKPVVARRAPRIGGAAKRESIRSGGKSGVSSETEAQQSSLGSPMQTSSPLQTPSRKFRTPGSSPAKISLAKTPSKLVFTEGSPSPTKIARAVSMFSRSSDVFAMDDAQVSVGSSSLSTLSNALEKLKMPAPSRPNTSLGFSHTPGEDDDNEGPPAPTRLTEPGQGGNTSQHNGTRRRSLSIGHGAPGGLSKNSTPTGLSSTLQAGPSTTKHRFIQKSMTSFFAKPGSSTMSSSNPYSVKTQLLGTSKTILNGAGAKGVHRGLSGTAGWSGGGGKLFPMANKRLVQKVSKKSSLPMVEASPIKGGGGISEATGDNIPGNNFIARGTSPSQKRVTTSDLDDIFMVPLTKGDDHEVQILEGSGSGEKSEKGKGKEKDEDKTRKTDSSRRASLALSQLSQSISAAPAYAAGDKRSMGPPATPRKIARSVSSNFPTPSNAALTSGTITSVASITTASSDVSSKSSPSPDKIPTPTGTRSSARQAARAAVSADSSSPASSADPGWSEKKDNAEKNTKGTTVQANKADSLKILKDCVIFVDVRTDDGEEAGSLFVEMLEGLGAKILSRVGQTCTHVIFKNGLMSTISRWRLLRDPKPSVVGIAWVVDCVEQRRHVDESSYIINLKEINVAGTHKRRRSMLPKLISEGMMDSTTTDVEGEEGEADVSMESTSSVTLDDDLTPLERARRRRSMIFGPPA